MRAERDRRAAILTAEGVKQSQILTAEGEKQSACCAPRAPSRRAILRAEGEAKAIDTVFEAIHEGDPDPKLLSYQYLQMLPKLAQGDANKIWVIPSEFTPALAQRHRSARRRSRRPPEGAAACRTSSALTSRPTRPRTPRRCGAPMERLHAEAAAELPYPQMLSGPVVGRLLETLGLRAAPARWWSRSAPTPATARWRWPRALPPGGRVVTLEIDDANADFAQRHIDASPLRRPHRDRARPGARRRWPRSTARSTWCSSTPTRPATPTTTRRRWPSSRRRA